MMSLLEVEKLCGGDAQKVIVGKKKFFIGLGQKNIYVQFVVLKRNKYVSHV